MPPLAFTTPPDTDCNLVQTNSVLKTRFILFRRDNGVYYTEDTPSGESSPSEADIKVTRDLIRAGQLLKLELLDM